MQISCMIICHVNMYQEIHMKYIESCLNNEAISSNDIYPAWTIAFQPPPNLMTSTHQIETIVSLCKTQAKDMLKTLNLMSSDEAKNCKERADAATQALKAYYQQLAASQYNLDEALNALVTLTGPLYWSFGTTIKVIFKGFYPYDQYLTRP